ncbi:MAG: Do family serine endopeptidase [Chlorobi bacterium]|nr:Do family serine endopeptidase [Chlorobiota bacterium]
MQKRNFFGAAALIFFGIIFGAVLVSNLGWVRPSYADVQVGADHPPLQEVNIDAEAFNDAFTNVAEKVTPSIVSIHVVSTQKLQQMEMPFKFFFDHPDVPQTPERKQEGSGSGVIISKDGYILTNNHVVKNAEKVTVLLNSKETYKAEVVGTDPLTDLAVIKIDADDDLPAAYLGDSDKLKVGQWVVAIGNPLGYLTSTVTAGIVSARGRNLNLINDKNGYGIEDFIQTDAAINPGNSGGALVDLTGAVVGINTAIATNGFNASYIGYGFAIPINVAKTVSEDLISYGKVRRGYIGIMIAPVDAAKAKALGLDKPHGVFINQIVEDGSASKADIQPSDVILSIDGKEVNQPNELQSYIATKRAGDEVTLKIFRDGDTIERTVTLKARKEDEKAVEISKERKERDKKLDKSEITFDNLGLTVRNMTSSELEKYGTENGILITKVEPYSPAQDQNLGRGIVISEVNKKSIDDVEQFEDIINDKKGDAILMKIVLPNGNSNFVGLEIPEK